MDERNKSECSYTKEQTISSTESLKANYGHSGSSNDIENLSFDNGSDDQSFDKISKLPAENSSEVDETFYNRTSVNELKKHFFNMQSNSRSGLYGKYYIHLVILILMELL